MRNFVFVVALFITLSALVSLFSWAGFDNAWWAVRDCGSKSWCDDARMMTLFFFHLVGLCAAPCVASIQGRLN